MPSLLRLSAIGLPLGLLLACGSSSTTTVVPDAATLIAVDPADFPGWDCAEGAAATTNGGQSGQGEDDPRAFGSYVAELVDASEIVSYDYPVQLTRPFIIQASPPTRCNTPVAFGKVTKLRVYLVRVDVYRESTAELCAVATGTSLVVARDTEGNCGTQPVAPIARLTCYGWREPAAPSTGVAGLAGGSGLATDGQLDGASEQAGNANSAGGSSSIGSATTGPNSVGGDASVGNVAFGAAGARNRPGMAIEYRTVKLRNCVADR